MILNEKYRPEEFKDIIGTNTKDIQEWVEKKDIPHLLFYGKPGTGKTTTALVIGKQLYKENFKSNFLELNASDERGIDIIRNKIKEFAQTRPIGTDILFKIVMLDEMDSLTYDAETALRRIMEKYHSNCRFILTANYLNKIIEPLRSRCIVLKFEQPDRNQIKDRLKFICEQEKIEHDIEALEKIVENHYPDIRKAINQVQILSRKGKIQLSDVEKPISMAISIQKHIFNCRFMPIKDIITLIPNGI